MSRLLAHTDDTLTKIIKETFCLYNSNFDRAYYITTTFNEKLKKSIFLITVEKLREMKTMAPNCK